MDGRMLDYDERDEMDIIVDERYDEVVGINLIRAYVQVDEFLSVFVHMTQLEYTVWDGSFPL